MISELGIVLSTNIPHRRNLEEERVVSKKVRYSRNQIHVYVLWVAEHEYEFC